MASSKQMIPTLLAESSVKGLAFRVVVEEYLHLMEDDGDLAPNDIALSVVAQQRLCQRFGRSVDDFSQLVEVLDAHRVVKLFWPSIQSLIEDMPSLIVVPETIVEYLSRHFHACRECYEIARRRVEIIPAVSRNFQALISRYGSMSR